MIRMEKWVPESDLRDGAEYTDPMQALLGANECCARAKCQHSGSYQCHNLFHQNQRRTRNMNYFCNCLIQYAVRIQSHVFTLTDGKFPSLCIACWKDFRFLGRNNPIATDHGFLLGPFWYICRRRKTVKYCIVPPLFSASDISLILTISSFPFIPFIHAIRHSRRSQ